MTDTPDTEMVDPVEAALTSVAAVLVTVSEIIVGTLEEGVTPDDLVTELADRAQEPGGLLLAAFVYVLQATGTDHEDLLEWAADIHKHINNIKES